MKKVNIGLVRLLQFVVFVLFLFMVMVYFGTFLLLPLDAAVLLIKLMTAFGMNGMIATVIAVPVVAYLVFMVYKMPGLFKLLMDMGLDLVNTGKARVEEFNKMAEALKD